MLNVFNNITNDNNNNSKCSNKIKRIMKTLTWRQTQINSLTYKYKFDGNCNNNDNNGIIEVNQIMNGELLGIGTGTFVWPAAIVLCKYLEKNIHIIKDKRVIDIGTGTGITGLVASHLGAKEVCLTDQLQIIPSLRENVINYNNNNNSKSNNDNNLIRIETYEWGNELNHLNSPFEVIIVCDCVLPKLYPIEPLIKAIHAVMNESSIAIFSYEHRIYPLYDPRDEVRKLCSIYGLKVKVIPLSHHHEDYNCDEIELWEITMNNEKNSKEEEEEEEVELLQILEWGNHDYINIKIFNKLIHIKQNTSDVMGTLWASSVVLSRWILKNDTIFNIKNTQKQKKLCLELGSGCGLVGLSLLIKNMDVIVTDKDSMIETLNYNMKQLIEENNNDNFKINSSYEVASLDWSFFDDTYNDEKNSILKNSIIGDRCVDFIVCSDCLYNSASIRPLLNIINLFSNVNTVLIIANELRSALDEFILLARHDDTYRRTFQDIELTEEDIFVYRNDNERYVNRPIRLLISSISI